MAAYWVADSGLIGEVRIYVFRGSKTILDLYKD